MIELERLKDVSNVHSVDFENYAFARFKPRLEAGIGLREYFRLCGVWFSLEKSVARRLLRVFEGDFGVQRKFGSAGLELFVE